MPMQNPLLAGDPSFETTWARRAQPPGLLVRSDVNSHRERDARWERNRRALPVSVWARRAETIPNSWSKTELSLVLPRPSEYRIQFVLDRFGQLCLGGVWFAHGTRASPRAALFCCFAIGPCILASTGVSLVADSAESAGARSFVDAERLFESRQARGQRDTS